MKKNSGRFSRYNDDEEDDSGLEDDDEPDTSVSGGPRLSSMGPTVGTLAHAILVDMRISNAEKRIALERMMMELGHPSPDTPLTRGLLSRLGGGALGAMIARLLGTGVVGMSVGGLIGFSLGKLISDFYLGNSGGRRTSVR